MSKTRFSHAPTVQILNGNIYCSRFLLEIFSSIVESKIVFRLSFNPQKEVVCIYIVYQGQNVLTTQESLGKERGCLLLCLSVNHDYILLLSIPATSFVYILVFTDLDCFSCGILQTVLEVIYFAYTARHLKIRVGIIQFNFGAQ